MIRLGIIGLGQRLAHMLTCFQASSPSLRVVGIVDPDREGALARLPESERGHVRFFDTLDELLREVRPDALAIGTRCNLHAPIAATAAKSGLPIFLEKPIATSTAQALSLELAFARSRSEVVVSFPLRVSHLCNMVKARVEGGEIGRLEHILGVNYVPYGEVYFKSWYRDYQTTQGLFLQKATHDFDYLAFLAGAPIVRVAAMAQQGRVFRDRSLEPSGGDDSRLYFENIGYPATGMNEDSSSALLEFANGIQGLYTQVFYTKHEAQARGATLSGPQGTIRFDWYQNELKVHSHTEAKTVTDRPPEGLNHFGGDGVLADNFIAVIEGRAASLSPLSIGLQSVYACLAARESAETGRFVNVQAVTSLEPQAVNNSHERNATTASV